MSEEFGGRLPTEVLAEVARLPAGFLEEILEYRQLARAIAIYQQHPTADDELVRLIRVVDFELAQEEIDRG